MSEQDNECLKTTTLIVSVATDFGGYCVRVSSEPLSFMSWIHKGWGVEVVTHSVYPPRSTREPVYTYSPIDRRRQVFLS